MGWARANVMYDTLSTPPEIGTPLEALCIRIFTRRQKLKYMEALVTLATAADKDNRKKILDSYFDELFPHVKDNKWKDSQTIQEVLEREMERGPMLVQKEEM